MVANKKGYNGACVQTEVVWLHSNILWKCNLYQNKAVSDHALAFDCGSSVGTVVAEKSVEKQYLFGLFKKQPATKVSINYIIF